MRENLVCSCLQQFIFVILFLVIKLLWGAKKWIWMSSLELSLLVTEEVFSSPAGLNMYSVFLLQLLWRSFFGDPGVCWWISLIPRKTSSMQFLLLPLFQGDLSVYYITLVACDDFTLYRCLTEFQTLYSLQISCTKASNNVSKSIMHWWGFDIVYATDIRITDGIFYLVTTSWTFYPFDRLFSDTPV
jgi:hypothetical protein